MAEYTKLDQSQTQAILARYDIGDLKSSKLLSGGSENTNYKLTTSSGEFVLTVCEQKTKQEATHLADLLGHLENNHFYTSTAIVNKHGDRISLFEGRPTIIKSHLPGTIQKNIPLQTLHSLGQQLARLHLISAPAYLPKTVTFGKESFDQIEIYDKDSSFHHWLLMIRDAVEQHCQNGLPVALIHGDVFFDNVIISPDETTATIMDFEEACEYYRVFDIGMMLVGLCEESGWLDMLKARQVLLGYQQISELNVHEKNALQTFSAYAAAATAFWRHKQYRYVMRM